MKCFSAILCCVLVFAISYSHGASLSRSKRQVVPKEFANINIENYLKNDRAVQFQLKCIVYDGPCDRIGKYLKVTIPELLTNQCQNCDPAQRQRAGRLVQHIQQKFPKEWSDAVQKFQGGQVKKEDADRLESLLGVKLDSKLVADVTTTVAPTTTSTTTTVAPAVPAAAVVEVSSTIAPAPSSSAAPAVSTTAVPLVSSEAPLSISSVAPEVVSSSTVAAPTEVPVAASPAPEVSSSAAPVINSSVAPEVSSSTTAAPVVVPAVETSSTAAPAVPAVSAEPQIVSSSTTSAPQTPTAAKAIESSTAPAA